VIDIPNATNQYNINLFASDTNLLIDGSNTSESSQKATLCMNSMCEWFVSNKLSLSIDEICYTVFPAKVSDSVSI
jgi:hypothetical protein